MGLSNHPVLELCCFEWFQNQLLNETIQGSSFRAVLFRMVPKRHGFSVELVMSFRAVLFRMVPKREILMIQPQNGFRAVLFRMVPKLFSLIF